MKYLTQVLIFALFASLSVGGETARHARECPAISVSCRDIVVSGESVVFAVTVSGASQHAKLTYNWIVSAGKIVSGQGTSSIVVDTTGLYNISVTGAVDIKGLPDSCPDSASCTTAVPTREGYHDKVDEYGDIKFEDEQARLDNFAIELQNWPEGKGYIIAYGGRRSHPGEARKRAERAKRYITTVRNIPVRQVVVIDGGYREELTVELRLRSQNAPPPQPMPTVDPNEVRIIKATKTKGRRRR